MLPGLVCMNSKYALLLTDGAASYALSGAVTGQFALFAACLFPARLSRKTSSLQKTGKFGRVTRTDVRAMPEEFLSIGDLSSGLEIAFKTLRMPLASPLFSFSLMLCAKKAAFLNHVNLMLSKA